MTGVDVAAVASLLKTGDLVLFAGPIRTRGVFRWWPWHPWTHVGLLVRRPEDPEPLLWEAHRDGRHRGTTQGRLAARIAAFPGKISVRCLNNALTAAQCARLEALRQQLARRPPERGLLDLMAAADDGWLGAKPENLGELTGAELVAQAYQRLGLLDDLDHGGQSPSRYRPRRFAERAGLRLKHGYALGPEVVLHDPESAVGWGDASPQPA
jgi:hypothetical protein